MTMIDLTMEQFEGNASHPGHGRTPLILPGTVSHGGTALRKIKRPYGSGTVSVANELLMLSGHTGTHLDAPLHIDYQTTLSVDAIPLDRCSGDAVWLDLSACVGPNTRITAADVAAAEAEGGETIRAGDIVLVHTGWLDQEGLSTKTLVDKAPGLTKDAGEALRQRGIKAIAVDMVSPDCRDALDIPIHVNFLCPTATGLAADDYILIYENLVGISNIPSRRFIFHGLPLPFRGATASPVRAIAVVD